LNSFPLISLFCFSVLCSTANAMHFRESRIRRRNCRPHYRPRTSAAFTAHESPNFTACTRRTPSVRTASGSTHLCVNLAFEHLVLIALFCRVSTSS
jgi:hypothetical protein